MTAQALVRPEPGGPAAPPRAGDGWADALPALLVVGAGMLLAGLQGGYAPRTWYTAALFLVALLAVVVFAGPERHASRTTTLAVAALAAHALWSLASVAWAEDRGDAWDGGNRAVMYAVALALLTHRPWRRRPEQAVLGALAAGAALTAAGVLIATAVVDRPSELFLEGRLAAPIDYANATSSLWLIGLFPALWAATATDLAWWLRGLGLAGACLLLQVALLSQSRGAAIALGAAALLYVGLAPRRLPAVLALGALAGITAASFGTLTAVRKAATLDELHATLGDARGAVVVSLLIAGALGAGAALAGRHAPARLTGPKAGRAADTAVGALGVGLAVVVLVAIGDPGAWARERWKDFKTTGYEEVEAAPVRLGGSLGSNRYDFYRVALDDFRARPLTGRGADNFAVSYLRERRSDEAPRHPHSLAMRLLGQTGLVGTGLFAAFLVLAVSAVLAARRRATTAGRAVVAAASGGFAVWLLHAQADWLWAFPGLVLPALALLAVAAGLGEAGRTAARATAPRKRSNAVVAALVLLLVALSLAAPGLAARYTAAAFDDFADRPGRTLARLERAASLNRLSAEPLVSRAILARRLGRPQEALGDLERAVDREPSNWFAAFELGMQQAVAGRRTAALASLRRARALNPRQQVIARVERAVAAGTPIEPAEHEAILAEEIERRLKPVVRGP